MKLQLQSEQIEKLAIKHEDFGFGQIDSYGLTTHGFSPEGLKAFVDELLSLNQHAVQVHDYVWPQRPEHQDECIYACNYSPAQHLKKGELLVVVHPDDLEKAGVKMVEKDFSDFSKFKK